jgi:hypothetical protein
MNEEKTEKADKRCYFNLNYIFLVGRIFEDVVQLLFLLNVEDCCSSFTLPFSKHLSCLFLHHSITGTFPIQTISKSESRAKKTN